MPSFARQTIALALMALASLPAFAWQADSVAPEAASGLARKAAVLAPRAMVVAANPHASAAGLAMLRAGGTAVDAAIATQLVLGLVEPQSSGIGGGALLLVYDGKHVASYDGRETAPAAAGPDLFKNTEGKTVGFFDAVVGGRATGVPGVMRVLEMAHRQHGKLPWADLFTPAIRLATEGFRVSPRLAKLIATDPYLKDDAVAAAYYFDAQGRPLQAGALLRNPAYAQTLRELAAGGAQVFYEGRIARDIVAKVRGHARNPGRMTEEDLARYHAVERAPLCTDYRRWSVCGALPPSSGGIAIAQMMAMFETRDMAALAPKDGRLSADAVHVFSEAGRLAYADRARYVADTDFVPLPGGGPLPLVDKTYLASRAALIGERSMGTTQAGMPVPRVALHGDDVSPELPSTSHLSIVDAAGRAVVMTTTVENAFGTRQMVDGFMLNNQLTDFSAEPADANGPIANRVEGGKRPRSSMSPTLVFDKANGQLIMGIGSPGGSSIINYVAKTLVATLDWGMDLQQAIDLPNIGSRNGPTELEAGRVNEALIEALKARGHAIRLGEQTSGLHGFQRVTVKGKAMWLGASDPRREGQALGD